jgi:hypothetical protein
MSNITTRNDVKQLAEKIEVLAREVQNKLQNNNGDFLATANELVRNNLTFVFALGEVYALEQAGTSGKAVRATTVSNPSGTRWHNIRDSRGRFVRKV